jgi:hypothetical protein
MVREQLGLSPGQREVVSLQGLGNPGVNLLLPAPEQALVGGVADQRVLEGVARLGRLRGTAKPGVAANVGVVGPQHRFRHRGAYPFPVDGRIGPGNSSCYP